MNIKVMLNTDNWLLIDTTLHWKKKFVVWRKLLVFIHFRYYFMCKCRVKKANKPPLFLCHFLYLISLPIRHLKVSWGLWLVWWISWKQSSILPNLGMLKIRHMSYVYNFRHMCLILNKGMVGLILGDLVSGRCNFRGTPKKRQGHI